MTRTIGVIVALALASLGLAPVPASAADLDPACMTTSPDPLYHGVYTPGCVGCLPGGDGKAYCRPSQCYFVYAADPEFEPESQGKACGPAALCVKVEVDPADPTAPKTAIDPSCPTDAVQWASTWLLSFVCSPHCPQGE